MTLEDWYKNGRMKRHTTSLEEIRHRGPNGGIKGGQLRPAGVC